MYNCWTHPLRIKRATEKIIKAPKINRKLTSGAIEISLNGEKKSLILLISVIILIRNQHSEGGGHIRF